MARKTGWWAKVWVDTVAGLGGQVWRVGVEQGWVWAGGGRGRQVTWAHVKAGCRGGGQRVEGHVEGKLEFLGGVGRCGMVIVEVYLLIYG